MPYLKPLQSMSKKFFDSRFKNPQAYTQHDSEIYDILDQHLTSEQKTQLLKHHSVYALSFIYHNDERDDYAYIIAHTSYYTANDKLIVIYNDSYTHYRIRRNRNNRKV